MICNINLCGFTVNVPLHFLKAIFNNNHNTMYVAANKQTLHAIR